MFAVIASQRVGAKRRPMTGSAKQSSLLQIRKLDCFVASAFARRRASADKSAPRNDEPTISAVITRESG
jgi:hypothetical protein